MPANGGRVRTNLSALLQADSAPPSLGSSCNNLDDATEEEQDQVLEPMLEASSLNPRRCANWQDYIEKPTLRGWLMVSCVLTELCDFAWIISRLLAIDYAEC